MQRFTNEFGPARHLEVLLEANRRALPELFRGYVRAAVVARGGDERAASGVSDELRGLISTVTAFGPRLPELVNEGLHALRRLVHHGRPEGATDPGEDTVAVWLSSHALAVLHARHPDFARLGDSAHRAACERDVRQHLEQLSLAMRSESSTAFLEYIRWTAFLLQWLGRDAREFPELLEILSVGCEIVLDQDGADAAAELLIEGARVARDESPTPNAINQLTPRAISQRPRSEDAVPGDILRTAALDIGRLAATLYFARHPLHSLRQGMEGRAACIQDAATHVEHLADAMLSESRSVLADYLAWCHDVRQPARAPRESLPLVLDAISDALHLALPPAISEPARELLAASRSLVDIDSAQTDSPIDESTELGRLARRFNTLLLAGERHQASDLIMRAVDDGVALHDIYMGVFQVSQHEIGRLWQSNELSVAQEHFCTAATQLIMAQLAPQVFSAARCGHSMVATCVTEDYHEIGIRMVCDFFAMDGWDTYYLGSNTPIRSVVETVAQRRPDVLAISATLGTHLHRVRDMVAAVRADPSCVGVKILVGGLPFQLDAQLHARLGADATARDAVGAVHVGSALIGSRE